MNENENWEAGYHDATQNIDPRSENEFYRKGYIAGVVEVENSEEDFLSDTSAHFCAPGEDDDCEACQ